MLTIAIALKDVASQILSNAAGLGKEITASSVATENAVQHESNEAGVDLKPQLRVQSRLRNPVKVRYKTNNSTLRIIMRVGQTHFFTNGKISKIH